MRDKKLVFLTGLILLVLFCGLAYGDSAYIRPKYKISVFGGWGGYNLGNINGIDWINEDYREDPQNVEYRTDPNYRNNSIYFNTNSPEYAGQFSLGFNVNGPWYIVAGLHYEKWQEIRDKLYTYTSYTDATYYHRLGQSFYKTTAFIPFIAIEYTNRFWKLNYNSSIGIAKCHCRSEVMYWSFNIENESLGTFKYNSTGIILTGGLSYDLFGYTSINVQGGYRIFGGDKMESSERDNDVDIDFDYTGAFFGIGMSYGFGNM